MIVSKNSNIPITIHKVDDQKAIVVAINYSESEQVTDFQMNHCEITNVYYGDIDKLDKCSAVVFEIKCV